MGGGGGGLVQNRESPDFRSPEVGRYEVGAIEKVTTEKNFAARPLLKLYNSVNLPNFRQSPSLAVILMDLST